MQSKAGHKKEPATLVAPSFSRLGSTLTSVSSVPLMLTSSGTAGFTHFIQHTVTMKSRNKQLLYGHIRNGELIQWHLPASHSVLKDQCCLDSHVLPRKNHRPKGILFGLQSESKSAFKYHGENAIGSGWTFCRGDEATGAGKWEPPQLSSLTGPFLPYPSALQ